MVLSEAGQVSMGPSGVFDQSNSEMIPAILPPPVRNACGEALCDTAAVTR